MWLNKLLGKKSIDNLRAIHNTDLSLKFLFCNENNFGDIFNIYFVKNILKNTRSKQLFSSAEAQHTYYLFVGSIVHDLYVTKNSILCGVGIGSRFEQVSKPFDILMVRGPITRKRLLELGYACPDIYGDPMLILPLYYCPPIKKVYDVGFIPHRIDTDLFISKIPSNLQYSWLVIDLSCDEYGIENVVDKILSCKRTVSSSLHGLIASHSYEIPTMWINTINTLCGDGIKYLDYYGSLNIEDIAPRTLNFETIIDEIETYPQPTKETISERVKCIQTVIKGIR